MSLSRIFKDKSNFKPEKLVPGQPGDSDDWQPQNIQVKNHQEKAPSQRGTDSTKPSTRGNSDTLSANEALVSAQQINEIPDSQLPEAFDTDPLPPPEDAPPPPVPDLESLKVEAFRAGIAEGIRQAETDFGSSLSALTQTCDQLNTIRETILKNSKDEMIELVITLSEKIIRHSISEQNRTIIDTVEEAINQAVKSSEFYIYLHPDDIDTIQKRSTDFISGLNGLDNIIVKADPNIEKGGCKIESENCIVDATLSSQISIIQDHIREGN